MRENGDMGKDMGREEKFFIVVRGFLLRALLVVPMGKESGSIVKTVTYMKEIFAADIGKVKERCTTGMEIFIEDIGNAIKNMGSEG